jgi:hypothetical protein
MTQIYWSYLAGFIDADGSIIAQIVPRADYRWKFQIRLTLQFSQKGKSVAFFQDLQRSFGGIGYIRFREDGMCDYVITASSCVYKTLVLLRPF